MKYYESQKNNIHKEGNNKTDVTRRNGKVINK